MKTSMLIIFCLLFFGCHNNILSQDINEVIAFKAEWTKRERAVIDKLMEIRIAQKAYRGVSGVFASSFDELSHTLKNDSFTIVKAFEHPDGANPSGDIKYDTVFVSCRDSLQMFGINLDSLRFVPYGMGTTFEIQADTITYQNTRMPVVEVGIQRYVYMGPYSDSRFAQYDSRYDPKAIIKFGDLDRPSLRGNWEY